jgi:hypothetical protein
MYIVHLNYKSACRPWDRPSGQPLHLVRCPNGEGKLKTTEELRKFLVGKPWRYAQ